MTKQYTIIDALTLRGEPDSYERQENAWLLAEILGCSATELKLMGQQTLDNVHLQRYQQGLQRLADGEPLAYITGSQPFWTLDLTVSPETLVPRPDTEILVETALTFPLSTHANVLDLGTGTGAIALALASERPTWQVWASDISPKTLAVAEHNAEKHYLNQVQFLCGSWFSALDNLHDIRFDMIVSNPPYIDANDPHMHALSKEPRRALVADEQGLADLKHIIQHAPQWLKNGAYVVLEHGYDQANTVQQLFLMYGYQQIKTVKDYAGNDRITYAVYMMK